ncbi:MAG TPA: hypothetical protein PLO70_14360 [Chitinophagaceae bacterium]|nr:hypothetical protein [Chitinophagaceae bacterium]
MKKIKWLLFVCVIMNSFISGAQTPVDSIRFFTEEGIIEMTLTTDIRKLRAKESIEAYQPADISVRFPGNTIVSEPIRLYARGKSRRETCNLPPIMLDFHNPSSPLLYPLSRLKLVVGCGTSEQDEQLVLKEYILYKMYNLLEERSFRARLAKVTYNDSRGKMKSYSQYAFLLEDVDDMAKRNGCKASKKMSFHVGETDPGLMNKVEIFEYMIGNTDWSVPGNHNIKMIYPRNDEKAPVLPVPYDFDNSGLVNAYYAVPNELLGSTSVTQRIYRGYVRTLPEVQQTLDLFRAKKESLFALVKNFELFKSKTRDEIINYLNDFYKAIESESSVKFIFVDNARRE